MLCFNLQSRLFFCFSFVRTPSPSLFLSFTGMVCFRTTFLFSLGNRTFQALIQSNMGHFVTTQYDRSIVVMQTDTSSKLPATRDEQKQQSFSIRHVRKRFPWTERGASRFLPVESQTISHWRSSTGRPQETPAAQTTQDNTQVYLCQTTFSCNRSNVVWFPAGECCGTFGRGAQHSDK